MVLEVVQNIFGEKKIRKYFMCKNLKLYSIIKSLVIYIFLNIKQYKKYFISNVLKLSCESSAFSNKKYMYKNL